MADKWITVAPIFNMLIPPEHIPFVLEDGTSISLIPNILNKITPSSAIEQTVTELIAGASHCLLIEYEAEALNHKQVEAQLKISNAYLSFWLAKNTDFKFSGYTHIQLIHTNYYVRYAAFTDTCYVGASAKGASHGEQEFKLSIDIFNALQNLELGTPLFVARNAVIKGIREHEWEWRYLCFWVALEALFGADREITFRLSQRLGLFLGSTHEESSDIFKFVKKAYEYRSKVVHGFVLRKLKGSESIELMEGLESILRRATTKILSDPELTKTFQGSNRDLYLDQLAFK
jgi:hypothetical protein